MAGTQQLQFAQKFPFSQTAKKILREINPSIEHIPEETIKRAEVMISHASKGKPYNISIKSTEMLEQEIAAFPVAKILVSLMKDNFLLKSFASTISKSTFIYLEKSPDRKQLSLDLAEELGLDVSVISEKGSFVEMPLSQFLGIRFNDPALKLVNQKLSGGKVKLNINTFCRFVSEKVFAIVHESLPVKTTGLPNFYKTTARQISKKVKGSQLRDFNFKVEGSLNPNAFPPCFASLYQKQLAGEGLSHMARFLLASFLNAVGMPQRQILEIFKKSPNYDEKIASYQIKRIAEQNYAPASCAKIKTYGLCTDTDCRVRHPMTYYRRALKKLRQQNKKPAKKE